MPPVIAPTSATLERLAVDPYPTYKALRDSAPVAWMTELGMWWVTRYEDVRAVLLDTETFVTGTEASLLFTTFGEHMLTTEGARHRRYRSAGLNGAFMARSIHARLENIVQSRVSSLLESALQGGRVELRHSLAARLPVLTMLDLFGLPDTAESDIRRWYDVFGVALANHDDDTLARESARGYVDEAHVFLQHQIDAGTSAPGLLRELTSESPDTRLSDEEIRRNALIILFGGISTVEAAILNLMWALLHSPAALERARDEDTYLDAAFDETLRFLSPVQSATRHTTHDCEIAGVRIPAGATVNCMLASANHDERVFLEPDRFDPLRENVRKHLSFATGPHLCLGRHLARMETLAAVGALLRRTRSIRLAPPISAPHGHEFRQPADLWVEWDV